MQQFMVVSTFREGVNMQEVLQHVEAEKAKVKELQDAGRLGEIRMAVPQRKVFLDVFADDEDGAGTTVKELPMAVFWDLEVYKLSGTA
jgi:muconolactone delta-isomerase